ncbi:MAG: (Fe-S)-binding protein [Verrucomicrobia bacterium]|nr:(Fe-S)-binding protein [Verrucomicrobiota bacterium]
MRVSLFVPCFVDQLAPQVGLAAAKVLKRLGHEVDFRAEQTCCGQPSFNSGQWDVAREGALRTIQVFRGADVVVGPSGSCVAMIKKFYPELLQGTPHLAAAEDLAARTFEFSDFLVNRLGVTDVGAKFAKKVTYHDGCHALRELRLKEEPRKLLRAVQGLELIESEEGESCCGFGGLFSAKFPMISTAMVQVKGGALARTGADFVVSSDPSCLLQIGGWLSREGKPILPLHIAEVLAHDA